MRDDIHVLRVFATCDIGKEAIDLLAERGYDVEVYPDPEPPPKRLIVEKVRSGIDGLITTLRDSIDAEVFEAGRNTLKVVAQYAVGFDNINRADANRYKIPFTNTADVLTEATAEFALFILGSVARKLYPSERLVREKRWGSWHPYLPFLGDEVTGKTVSVIGTGRIRRLSRRLWASTWPSSATIRSSRRRNSPKRSRKLWMSASATASPPGSGPFAM